MLNLLKFVLSLLRKKSLCDCVSLVKVDSCEFLIYGLQVVDMHISSYFHINVDGDGDGDTGYCSAIIAVKLLQCHMQVCCCMKACEHCVIVALVYRVKYIDCVM